jgi:hypothetical protein
MEKIDGQSSDPGVSEQLVSRLEKHLKRLPTGELVFSNKYLETMEVRHLFFYVFPVHD